MKEIVFISPYQDLYDQARRICEEKGYNNIEVTLGDLEQGVERAVDAERAGCGALISRGGTYEKIKRAVSIPVVELELTAFDVFKSFRSIKGIDRPMAIIGYNNIIGGYDVIRDLFEEKNVVSITLDHGSPVKQQLLDCARGGVEIFVGDSVVTRTAKELGFESHYIASSDEAVASAMEEARRILASSYYERERTQRYMVIMDSCSDGAVSTDGKGVIVSANANAAGILGTEKDLLVGMSVGEALGPAILEFTQNADAEKRELLYQWDALQLSLNLTPIRVGAENMGHIITFQPVDKIQSLEKKIRRQLSQRGFVAGYHFEDILHQSEPVRQCIERAKVYSNYDSCVLITGQSGVGKELFAQSIHNHGRRAKEPFVPVNCAALPPSLIESELFGYAEGAFTGAKKGGKSGLFEMAHNGSIFLDEISELPMDLQGRLLRVIQERQIMHIGDDRVIPVDVRIICASNQNLRQAVQEGRFRRDLLFRINVLTLPIPSLNDRREDIPLLAEFFVDLYCKKYSMEPKRLGAQALAYLQNYNYEGNVRELQGMMERAVVLTPGAAIALAEVDEGLPAPVPALAAFEKEWSLKEMEAEYIRYLGEKYPDSPKRVCDILGIDRSTYWRKRSKGAE